MNSVRDATAVQRRQIEVGGLAHVIERERTLGLLLMIPGALFLLVFIAYPFFLGIWLSLTDSTVGTVGRFVGLQNFVTLARQDTIFQQTVRNTFVYSFITVPFKLVLG